MTQIVSKASHWLDQFTILIMFLAGLVTSGTLFIIYMSALVGYALTGTVPTVSLDLNRYHEFWLELPIVSAAFWGFLRVLAVPAARYYSKAQAERDSIWARTRRNK